MDMHLAEVNFNPCLLVPREFHYSIEHLFTSEQVRNLINLEVGIDIQDLLAFSNGTELTLDYVGDI